MNLPDSGLYRHSAVTALGAETAAMIVLTNVPAGHVSATLVQPLDSAIVWVATGAVTGAATVVVVMPPGDATPFAVGLGAILTVEFDMAGVVEAGDTLCVAVWAAAVVSCMTAVTWTSCPPATLTLPAFIPPTE